MAVTGTNRKEKAVFHHKDGWYFGRLHDGSVLIQKRGLDGGILEHVIDVDSWASIVAAVSVSGETRESWQLARVFHIDDLSIEREALEKAFSDLEK
jgi:hypothetical protein